MTYASVRHFLDSISLLDVRSIVYFASETLEFHFERKICSSRQIHLEIGQFLHRFLLFITLNILFGILQCKNVLLAFATVKLQAQYNPEEILDD